MVGLGQARLTGSVTVSGMLSRRRFLAGVSALTLAGGAGLLSACTQATPTAAPTQPPAAAPTQPAATKPGPSASSSPSASGSASPVAASPSPSVAPAVTSTVSLKVGTLRIVADAGLYAAVSKGYFKEQGLDIQFVDFNTAAETIAPLAANQLDIGGGAVTAGLFNAVARGLPLKVVADKAALSPDARTGFTSSLWFALPKSVDPQAFTFADFKGKRIAISSTGTASEVLLARTVEKAGLKLSDVESKVLSFPDMTPALVSGGIDIAEHIEPFASIGSEQGLLTKWKNAQEVYPGQQVGIVMYGPSLSTMSGDVGNRFMVAYVRGLRDYNDAFGPNKKNRAEMVNILTQFTSAKDPSLYDKISYDYMNPDGYVNAEAMDRDLDWYVQSSVVSNRPDLKMIVDNRYCDYAVQILGKYQA